MDVVDIVRLLQMNPISQTLEAATAFVDDGSDSAKSENEETAKPFSRGQKMAVKFLLNNIAAGVIIGRGGTNITELQQHSGARIQLSRNNEFYPGTEDRVMLISGTVKAVLTALYLILTKLAAARKNGQSADHNREDDALASILKLIMPNACCGAILGKGGKTVKHFVEESGASINVLPQNYLSQDMDNRIISISGELEQILRAVAHIVAKVADDPHYINNVSLSVNYVRPAVAPHSEPPARGHLVSSVISGPYAAAPEEIPVSYPPAGYPQCAPVMYQPIAYGGEVGGMYADPQMRIGSPPTYVESETVGSPTHSHGGMSVPFGVPLPVDARGPRVEMSISIPDERIGAIIGKGGDIINQLQALVGVKIIISSRNEFEPGTRNRRVTIIGPPDAVQIAHMLISMKERTMFFNPSGSVYPSAPYAWPVPAAWGPPSSQMPESTGYN